MKRSLWEKEWIDLQKREETYIRKHSKPASEGVLSKLQNVVPDGLQSKLEVAFVKAFQVVFEKGTGLIEKTYDKEKRRQDYEIAEYAARVREDRRHVGAFRRRAAQCTRRNLLLSSVEGIGLGILGVGIPDIPLFVSVMCKSLYEISLSFGYAYDGAEERLFQLKLMETALYSGQQMEQRDDDLNTMCQSMRGAKQRTENDTTRLGIQLDAQIRETAKALSDELLYAKFLQGMPVVGAVGGATDVTVLRRVTAYATLKYRRRYLLDRQLQQETQ